MTLSRWVFSVVWKIKPKFLGVAQLSWVAFAHVLASAQTTLCNAGHYPQFKGPVNQSRPFQPSNTFPSPCLWTCNVLFREHPWIPFQRRFILHLPMRPSSMRMLLEHHEAEVTSSQLCPCCTLFRPLVLYFYSPDYRNYQVLLEVSWSTLHWLKVTEGVVSSLCYLCSLHF